MKSEIDVQRTLKNITDSCYKILEINLADDTYKCIKSMVDETKNYYSLTRWIMEYTVNDKIYPEDRISFIKTMNIYQLKKYFDKNDKPKRFYYRRKINDSWVWVCLELTKDYEYSPENPIVYLAIRDIDDEYINKILDSHYTNNEEYDDKTKLRNYNSYKHKIADLQKDFGTSIGLICVDTKNFVEDDYFKILRILKLLFKFEQIYSINNDKFSIIIEGIDSEEFQLKLLQIYGLFCASKLKDKIKIASGWSDDEENGLTFILNHVRKKIYRADEDI